MGDNAPLWFKAIITAELLFQLPFFFVAVYGLWYRRNWLRTPGLLYGAHVCTTLVPIMAQMILDMPERHKAPQVPHSTSAALARLFQACACSHRGGALCAQGWLLPYFYLPYFFLPLLFVIVLLPERPFGAGNGGSRSGARGKERKGA